MTHHAPSLSEKFTIAMIGFFAFLQVYSVQAILPVLIHDLNANEIEAGMAVGATVLAIAVISPFIGMLSDGLGRKPFIIGGLFLLAVPTGLIGLSSSMSEITVWRFLQGISVPGITVVLIAYISEEYSEHIATMMALYVSGTVLGGFSGRFFAGHLEHFIGWRYGYGVMAICTLIGALWVLKTLPKSKNFVVSESFKDAFDTLIAHTKNPHVISSSILGACVLFTLVGCFTFVNLHLADAPYQLSTADLANIFSIYLIGMVITPLSAKITTRFGTTTTIILAVLTSAVGIGMTLLTPLWAVIVGLTLMSSGVFVTQSATISYLTSHVKHGRSLASGLYYMAYYGGGFIGAWICALAYAQGQWLWTVGLILILQVIALGIVVGFMRGRE
ncbi:MFS transporter [uncultured Moraxella sp.]|uniref:MFS transporter n=1 Tax=uncultured Moraxella sp. TaxID=263769 RepID=UPI0025CC12D2|nr:MFS transporter [uncultured Moraxella sp.]